MSPSTIALEVACEKTSVDSSATVCCAGTPITGGCGEGDLHWHISRQLDAHPSLTTNSAERRGCWIGKGVGIGDRPQSRLILGDGGDAGQGQNARTAVPPAGYSAAIRKGERVFSGAIPDQADGSADDISIAVGLKSERWVYVNGALTRDIEKALRNADRRRTVDRDRGVAGLPPSPASDALVEARIMKRPPSFEFVAGVKTSPAVPCIA